MNTTKTTNEIYTGVNSISGLARWLVKAWAAWVGRIAAGVLFLLLLSALLWVCSYAGIPMS